MNQMLIFLKKQDWGLRFQQLIIVILHLILLKWMHYALTESGTLTIVEVMAHFTGMSIYGAVLIRACAAWGKWLHEKDLKRQNDRVLEN